MKISMIVDVPENYCRSLMFYFGMEVEWGGKKLVANIWRYPKEEFLYQLYDNFVVVLTDNNNRRRR